jgi:hypothetical protein
LLELDFTIDGPACAGSNSVGELSVDTIVTLMPITWPSGRDDIVSVVLVEGSHSNYASGNQSCFTKWNMSRFNGNGYWKENLNRRVKIIGRIIVAMAMCCTVNEALYAFGLLRSYCWAYSALQSRPGFVPGRLAGTI